MVRVTKCCSYQMTNYLSFYNQHTKKKKKLEKIDMVVTKMFVL
jgi:hypothetical protein